MVGGHCFEQKKKIVHTSVNSSFYCKKVVYKGVKITRGCYHDVNTSAIYFGYLKQNVKKTPRQNDAHGRPWSQRFLTVFDGLPC